MAEEVISFNEALEKKVKKEFGDLATPEFINLLRLGKAAYEHGYFNFIPKEKVMEWVGSMYESGQQQRKLRNGEEGEGMITIDDGDVMGAGSFLDLFGKNKGYLSNS
jgi:hypothetical protein